MDDNQKLKKVIDFLRQLSTMRQLDTPVSDMQWQLTLQFADFLLEEIGEK